VLKALPHEVEIGERLRYRLALIADLAAAGPIRRRALSSSDLDVHGDCISEETATSGWRGARLFWIRR
jgi:hypothetical protein